MSKTGFIFSNRYLDHDTGRHPEQKERLSAIIDYLERTSLMALLQMISPRKAEKEELCPVHDPVYVDFLRKACGQGLPSLDADTVICPQSYEIACLAAGALLEAADAVMEAKVDNAFCAVRPPGHHAERDRGMGFCLFNNVAVAARYLQKKHRLNKILIIDWDVHHGNGTSHMFYDDPSVFYMSIHQYPHYPGTGSATETGAGEGVGATLNIPFPGGEGDLEYIQAFEERIVPAARKFHPDFILVSAGFDAHRDDFLAGMQVTAEGFGQLTEIVRGLADQLCRGRLVSVLEGGYNLEALGESVGSHIKALLNPNNSGIIKCESLFD